MTLRGRLQQCSSEDLNWDLFPSPITEVCVNMVSALREFAVSINHKVAVLIVLW